MNTKHLVYPFLILSLMFFNSSALAAKRALVYKGAGACDDGCYEAAYQMAIRAGLDPSYVSPTEIKKKTPGEDLFKDVVLWLQPGGHSAQVVDAMTPALKTALDQFVKNGGAYVGFCAGAFASTALVGTTGKIGFGFMPGSTKLYPTKGTARIFPVMWNGKTRNLYWEGGPYLSIPEGAAEIIATYPNGAVAAARSTYGKGRVFVTGLHPEAPQFWRDYYQLNDADGTDEDLAVEMIQWAIKSNDSVKSPSQPLH